MCKEPLPASLLLLTVVYPGAALFGWAEVALVCAGGAARPIELLLIDLNASSLAHS